MIALYLSAAILLGGDVPHGCEYSEKWPGTGIAYVSCRDASIEDVARELEAHMGWKVGAAPVRPDWRCTIDRGGFTPGDVDGVIHFLAEWGIEVQGNADRVLITTHACTNERATEDECRANHDPRYRVLTLNCTEATISTLVGAVNRFSEWRIVLPVEWSGDGNGRISCWLPLDAVGVESAARSLMFVKERPKRIKHIKRLDGSKSFLLAE